MPSAPLCLEENSSERMLDALRQVKVSLRDLPETANLTDEWPRLVEPLLGENAFGGFILPESGNENDVITDVCYDVDMLGIGMSHSGCCWGNISSLSRDPKMFQLDFEPSTNSNRTGLGLHAWLVQDSARIPFRSIPQALIAKAHFGTFVCDLVLFGKEGADVSEFQEVVTKKLLSGIAGAAANVSKRMRAILNHLISSLRNPLSANSTYIISDLEASALILNNLQKALPNDHHIFLVDFGCKCRSCTAAFESTCTTRRSHCERAWSSARSESPLPKEWDWSQGFNEILSSNLNMDSVHQNATFMIADLGVEFSSPGRFMHWTAGACKAFQSSFGGKGSLYFALGIRQLASYTTRATEFERFSEKI